MNQTKKDKYCGMSLTRGIKKKNQIYRHSNRLMVTRGWKVGEMGRYWAKGTKFQL